MSWTPTPKTAEEVASFRELAEQNKTEFLKRLLELGADGEGVPEYMEVIRAVIAERDAADPKQPQ